METLQLWLYVVGVIACSDVINAVVESAVWDITPRVGSMNGHTLLTVNGVGFSKNQFNDADKVTLVSKTRSFVCDIHRDGCHERQLTCYTRPMPEDDYFVRVSVNGQEIPINKHCRYETDYICRFKPVEYRTPYITLVEPRSGPPGTVVKVTGRLMTSRVFSSQGSSTNGNTARIRRVFQGQEICNLKKNENTDELWGIELQNSGTSSWGWLKCKTGGNYIGNTNVSLIVEGAYGRAENKLETKHISHSNQIYMFQSYAVVDSVTPAVGSNAGGTEITIKGNYFDELNSKAKVMVGGVPCVVTKPVKINEIVCRTPVQQSQPHYSGNRGAKVQFWNDTYVWKVGIDTMFTRMKEKSAEFNYETWYDGAGFLEHSDNKSENSRYGARSYGWFHPPADGDYVFYMLTDDGGSAFFSESGNISELVEITRCNGWCSYKNDDTRGYKKYDTQISKPFALKAGKKYYFEMRYADWGNTGYGKLGVKIPTTNYVASQSFDALNEKQTIKVMSTVRKEIQTITMKNWATGSNVDEVQEVSIIGNSAAKFRLGLKGTFTETLDMTSTQGAIATALGKIPTLGSVSVTKTTISGGIKLVVTLKALGDVPDLSYDSPDKTLKVTVTEKTRGVPSLSKLRLVMNDVPSPSFSSAPSTSQLQQALGDMFSVRCPSKLDGSASSNNVRRYHFGFEDTASVSNSWGIPSKDQEPFCGKTSLKKPTYLFNADNVKYYPVVLGQYKVICFAYKGSFTHWLALQFSWKSSSGAVTDRTYGWTHEFDADVTSWHYTCIDLQAVAMKDKPDGTEHKMKYLRMYPKGEETYVDEVEITKLVVVPTEGRAGVVSERVLPPRGILMEDIMVEKPVAGTYKITLSPYNCANNFQLSVMGSLEQSKTSSSVTYGSPDWPANVQVQFNKDSKSTPPVGGTFTVKHNGVTKVIPASITADQLASELQSLPGMGHIEVEREGLCHNYTWVAEWIDVGGDQSEMVIDGASLTGNNVSISVTTNVDGGILYDIIPGEMVSTYETKPQVVVTINKIPTACTGNCDFEWTQASTPVITDLQPTSGSTNTELTLTGTNLLGVANAADPSSVVIGGASCVIKSHTDTQIKCDIGEGSLGTHDTVITVAGKGYARHDPSTKQFTFQGSITSISPTKGSRGGGVMLEINGNGFNKASGVTVGGVDCPVVSYNYTDISCTVPARPANNPDQAAVKATNPGGDLTSSTPFTYSQAMTPTINSVSTTTSQVWGGESVVIEGSNLEQQGGGAPDITLCGKTVQVVDRNASYISALLPANKPGTCPLLVGVQGSGNAVSSSNVLPTIQYTLSVTASYPVEGSTQGGTHLTIKGQGFPTNQALVNVTIGKDTGCDVTESSANKIVCKTGKVGMRHKVTNMGTSPIHGTGYAWQPAVLTVGVGESVFWQWAVPALVQHKGYSVVQVVSQTDNTTLQGGFSNGMAKTKQGSFEQTFNVIGEYHYTSGPVDNDGDIVMKGIVKVVPRSSVSQQLRLQVAGIEAEYQVTSGDTVTPAGQCIGTVSTISGCTTTINTVDKGMDEHFNFTHTVCHTPVVTAIGPNEVTPGEEITIDGTGFGSKACENEVMIGSHSCTIDSTTTTQLKCHIPASSKAMIYRAMPVTVRVQNRGAALIQIQENSKSRVIVKPYFNSITPSQGSVAGGTLVTLAGAGFPTESNALTVSTNGQACAVKTATYIEVVCQTGAKAASSGDVKVTLAQAGVPPAVTCKANDCTFTYSQTLTSTVSAITTVAGNAVGTYTVKLAGDYKTVNVNGAVVTVGAQACSISTSTATLVECQVTGLVSGDHVVSYFIPPAGFAEIQGSNKVTIAGSITAVTPAAGSRNGGTKLTISGSVFNNDQSTTIAIGQSNCKVVTVTLDTITCVTESGSGQSDVVVTSNAVTLTSPQQYDFSAASTPTVTAIAPASGTGAVSLTLTGTTLSTTAADNSVIVGQQACTPTQATATEVRCDLPAMGAGVYDVTVSVKGVGLASISAGVTFTVVPTLTGVTPAAGSFGGGQTVTISGNGLAAQNITDVAMTVCGNMCDVTANTMTEVTCVTPPNTGSGTVACDVVVSLSSQTATLSSAYTYDDTKTPTISDVQPRRGGTGGGTRVTITGTKFGNSAAAVSVTIAGVTCDVDSSKFTATKLECVTNGIPRTTNTKIRLQISDCRRAGQDKADFKLIDLWSSSYTVAGDLISDYGIAGQDNAAFEYIDLWSSPYTWGGGPLPVTGDLITIKKGQTILLDTNTPILKTLLIQGGSLIFDRKDLELNAEIILITDGGLLQVGTEADPFLNKATIKLHGHLMSKELPIYGTKVLAVREGTLDLHGRPTPVTWTHLASTAAAGSTTLVLKVPVNWLPGDNVVIPTTSHRHSQIETEVRQISAISADGLTLTLNQSLTYSHISVEETISGVKIEMRGEVGLLSHNIKIGGYNDAQWNDKIEACADGFDTGEFKTQTCFQGRAGAETDSDNMGGQIMLHTPTPDSGNLTARIEYVELNYMGQAFRLGRYPVHYHLLGNMKGSYVRGLGIHQTFNRAINIHGTHNVLIEHNVVYNVMGGALFLEDGIETGNIFQYNLAVYVKSSTSLLNDDITPASFWITNPNNTIRHNSAVGGTHFGYWYRMHDHPDGPSYDKNICPKKVPLGEFYNNTAHSFGWFGLWIFEDYFPTADGKCNSNTPAPAVFKALHSWNCEKCAEWVNCGDIQFKDFVCINNEKAGIEAKMVVSNKKFKSDGPMMTGGVMVGHTSISSSTECTTAGIVLPFDSGLTVKDVTFINFDRNCQMFTVARVDGKCIELCGGYHYETSGLITHNSPNPVKFRWEHEAVILDLDGTLTGTAGKKVVPWSDSFPANQCTKMSKYSRGFPGAECAPSVEFVRFAFNHPTPHSLKFKNAIFVNSHGQTQSPWADKRLTHKQGWMALLVSAENYDMYFENAGHVTNISYDGAFFDLRQGQHIIMTTNVSTNPDRIRIKPGDTRVASQTPVTYKGSLDGDFFYNSLDKKVSYLASDVSKRSRKRRATVGLKDSSINLRVYKCFYVDCIIPKDPNDMPPTEGRPSAFDLWSAAATWQKLGVNKPQAGDDVTIPQGMWLVVDEAVPTLKTVNIFGTLEFENATQANGQYHDLTLTAMYIFIKGGRFVIGWPSWPYQGKAKVVLQGSHSTTYFKYPAGVNGPTLGAKFMGVFGGVDFHGKTRKVHWTSLAATAAPGSNTITVDTAVDWVVGDEIVLTTTSCSAWQTETFKITATDGTTLTLNATLKHRHLGETYTIPNVKSSVSSRTTYTIKAKVGLLSHNVKIVGGDYNKRDKESFGARVLVGALTDQNKAYVGYTRLNNVEFVNTGQEGFVDFYDPRFSLAFLDVGDINDIRPSHVTGCSFHDGYATAIGVYGTNNLLIQKNVIHRTVNHGVQVWGNRNYLITNLITLVVWPGSYNGRKESTNFDSSAGVAAEKAKSLTMRDNVVAGSEQSGYNVQGESCDLAAPMWKNNDVYGGLRGVLIMPDWAMMGVDCIKLHGFNIYKGSDFGIYSQSSASLKVDNVLLVDNTVGLFPMTVGPNILSHVKVDKYVHVSGSTVIGSSPHFDCAIDVQPNDDNYKFSGHARSFRSSSNGHVGLSFPNFITSPNNAPMKPWIGLMSYPAIGGIMKVKDTHFANFKSIQCNGAKVTDVMFSGNPNNDDAQHPIEITNIGLGDVIEDGKVFMPRPRLGSINPSDCVDMDCDGQKKTLIKDLTASLFNPPVPVAATAQSEFEWGGDKRRGLGDYRIPKTLLTDVNGNRLDVSVVAPHKGIIRNANCLNKTSTWHAYVCHDLNYEMMIIESMDKDTEKRRLSPVAVLGNGHLDLINGPQDHGWCDGYTCQLRVSTFYTIVATDNHFDIYFTSTNPQHTRFYLLNTEPTAGVRLAVSYSSPNRLDIYRNGKYVLPTNSGLNSKGENILLEPTSPGQYVPAMNTPSGTNYFDSTKKMQYIIVKGTDTVDIITSPKVVLSFSLPAMTVDQFFDGAQIVNNLAAFLGIPASKIKIVKIVRANGSGRRKRAADAKVEIEISDDPVSQISTNANGTDVNVKDIHNQIVNISETIVTATQLGTLATELNITLLNLAVIEPLPLPDNPAWVDVTRQLDAGDYSAKDVPIPSSMKPVEWTGSGVESSGLSSVPVIHVTDSSSNHVSLLGSTSSPWEVTAKLRGGTNSQAKLVGDVTIPFQSGYANFTNLAISHTGLGYMIDFVITKPTEAKLATSIGPFNITSRTLTGRAVAMATRVTKGSTVDVTLEVVEAMTNRRAVDIFWKGHSWDCTISLYSKARYPGQLTSNQSMTVAVGNDSLAVFRGLQLSKLGKAAFAFSCVTTPASSYSFTGHSKVMSVRRPNQQMPRIEATKAMRMKFNENYDRVTGQEDLFIAVVDNHLTHKHPNAVFDGYSLSRGSIIVTFWLNGTKTDVDSTIATMWKDLQTGGYTVDFGGLSVSTMEYLSVDDQQQKSNVVEKADDDGLHIGAIIGIGIAIGLIIFIIILVLFKVFYKPRKQIDVITPESSRAPSKTKLKGNDSNSLGSSTSTQQTGSATPYEATPSPTDTVVTNSQVIMVQDNQTGDILGRPATSDRSSVNTGIGGSVNSHQHPFGMEGEKVDKIEGTGTMMKGSRPGSKEGYNQENEAKKVLDDFKVVMDYMAKNQPEGGNQP